MESDWVFDGGRPCLDLLNTLRDRRSGGRELLTDARALAEWLRAAGLATRRLPAGADDLAAARQLRSAVDDLLLAPSEGRQPRRASVRQVNRAALAAAIPVPQLRFGGDGALSVHGGTGESVPSALAFLAVDAIELAGSGVAVRECAADDCGLRFADSSPKRNRQWCSMTRCGNRAKARAHYARVRGGE